MLRPHLRSRRGKTQRLVDRAAGGRASWGARLCLRPGAGWPPGPGRNPALPEAGFFVWGGERPAEPVPRVSSEAAQPLDSNRQSTVAALDRCPQKSVLP